MNNQKLKARITSIRDTVKITRAMQMIATSKMQKALVKREESHRFLLEYRKMMQIIDVDRLHAHMPPPKTTEEAVIVVAGEKGLCGDFNQRILTFADIYIKEHHIRHVFAVGYEASEHYKSQNVSLVTDYAHLQEPHAFDAIILANDLLDMYQNGLFGKVSIIYTKTPSLSGQKPCVMQLWPLVQPEPPINPVPFEPNTYDAAVDFYHQYLVAEIYSAMADSYLAIQYKRMTAMQESSDNGEEMLTLLTKKYNHQRQESITNDLITAAASGMRGKI